MKFYAGLPVVSEQPELNGHHITTMFATLIPTERFHSGEAARTGHVESVVYWPQCDKTVALVNCPYAGLRHAYWSKHGFKYDYAYVPHITICDGDQAYHMQHLVGVTFNVTREYIRLMSEN